MKALLEAAAQCRTGQPLPDALIALVTGELLAADVALEPKADFLRAFTDKGETATELAAFVRAFLPHAVDPGFAGTWDGKALLDCCGPGGGGLPLFNVSTATVFVLAALGVPVVKHGNRGVTKKSGSADVLQALGIRIDLPPEQARRCLAEVGAVFFFAPHYHPAFAQVAPVRQLLAIEGRRTLFNLLGPILNPAQPAAQLVGVFYPEQLALYDETLRALGRQRHEIVLGRDAVMNRAIGEVSVTGPNEFRGNVDLAAWKIPTVTGDLHALEVSSAEESAARIIGLLNGEERGLGRTLLEANAAVALGVQGSATTWDEAIARVREAIDSGRARDVIKRWQNFLG